jgi:hypothetical protein
VVDRTAGLVVPQVADVTVVARHARAAAVAGACPGSASARTHDHGIQAGVALLQVKLQWQGPMRPAQAPQVPIQAALGWAESWQGERQFNTTLTGALIR